MIESEVLEVRVGDVHVTPEQVADANIGTFGPDDYVLSTGRKLEAQVVTNNSVRVFDGVMVYGGIRDVISVNKYYDIQIDNGAQGMNRNDIIVRHFAITDEVTKRGGATFRVIKGTPSEGEAADPEIAFTDLRAGALSHDMILHRVRIEGLNIVAVEPLYDILYNAAELKEEVTKLNRKLLPWDAWRQSFLGTHIYRLQFGDINGNIIQTNQLSIPWLPSEVTVALSKINIPGAGTIAIDYKSAYLTTEGGLYIYCSTAGAAGVASLKWQVVDATIVIQRK